MSATWSMQDAKARLSELVKQTAHGPQDITVHGKSVAVVLARADYERLAHGGRGNLVDFLRASPLCDAPGQPPLGLDLARDRTPLRDLDL